jgi:hypothetical protein
MRDEPKEGPCVFCQKACTDDNFCSGCKSFVCDSCNKAGVSLPWGGHAKDAHLVAHDEDVDGLED